MNDEAPRALRIELSPRTLILILLMIAGVWLAIQLWTVFVVLLVALVLVGTFDPLVGWFERRGLGRGRALALIFFATALALAAILLVTIPPLVAQLQHILEDLPQERSKVIRFLGQYQLGAPFVKTVRAIPLDSIVVKAGDALLGYSGQILTALGYAVTTIFLALYTLAVALLWRYRERVIAYITRARIPRRIAPGTNELPWLAAVTMLAVFAIGALAFWIDLELLSFAFRATAAVAVIAQFFALAQFAEGHNAEDWRRVSIARFCSGTTCGFFAR